MQVERLGDGPIIVPHMDARMGENINGPSLLRVPDWLPGALGRYYLYFGHHDGRYIRLAHADHLQGPWRLHEPGVLPLEASAFRGHLASPDVQVDDANREIRLYFHGCDRVTGAGGEQRTRVARSTDGLNFGKVSDDLCGPYLRAFRRADAWYGLVMPGRLLRSTDGLGAFEAGPDILEASARHCAVLDRGDHLWVFYTRVGDQPERIVVSRVSVQGDWHDWRAEPAVEVLAPLRAYEGADCPVQASRRGMAAERRHELRDPCVFDEHGEVHLLYAVAGEHGIALAHVRGLD